MSKTSGKDLIAGHQTEALDSQNTLRTMRSEDAPERLRRADNDYISPAALWLSFIMSSHL